MPLPRNRGKTVSYAGANCFVERPFDLAETGRTGGGEPSYLARAVERAVCARTHGQDASIATTELLIELQLAKPKANVLEQVIPSGP